MEQKSNNSFCDNLFDINGIKNNEFEDNPEADNIGYEQIKALQAKEDLAKSKDDRSLRKEYASKVFLFISYWSAGLFIVLLLVGFKKISLDWALLPLSFSYNFSLSDNVLITLLTTSFIEVLGLFYFVMSYLFPKKKNKDQ